MRLRGRAAGPGLDNDLLHLDAELSHVQRPAQAREGNEAEAARKSARRRCRRRARLPPCYWDTARLAQPAQNDEGSTSGSLTAL